MEKRLEACTNATQKIPDKLNDIQGNITKILNAGPKINNAVEKLSSLDHIIAETETRMEDLQNSRMLISNTENRLQQLSKEAQDQIKLLHDITKANQSRPKNGTEHAPPIGVRDNVIELAHKGWKPEEIANTLKLSISEVELILDYKGTKD